MIRPRGVRSVDEIRQLEPRDRIPAYATLLELILRDRLPRDQRTLSLNELIQLHEDVFPNPEYVSLANRVRNDLIHARGESSPDHWHEAAYILEQAILLATQ